MTLDTALLISDWPLKGFPVIYREKVKFNKNEEPQEKKFKKKIF